MPDREEEIRQRAHQIWIEEGRPEGRHSDHWERATRELGENKSADPMAEASDSAGIASELKGGGEGASETNRRDGGAAKSAAESKRPKR